jgi:hypothetical protein
VTHPRCAEGAFRSGSIQNSVMGPTDSSALRWAIRKVAAGRLDFTRRPDRSRNPRGAYSGVLSAVVVKVVFHLLPPGQHRGNQTHRDRQRFKLIRREQDPLESRLTETCRDRSGQLLIPRSKVRILHGPFPNAPHRGIFMLQCGLANPSGGHRAGPQAPSRRSLSLSLLKTRFPPGMRMPWAPLADLVERESAPRTRLPRLGFLPIRHRLRTRGRRRLHGWLSYRLAPLCALGIGWYQ